MAVAENLDCSDVESVVNQHHWEPRHEWEARVKFVEDYVTDYGLEKATNLSIIWANMNFLGCNYPPGTEALVKDYLLPSYEELKARRKSKAKNSTQNADVSALIASIHSQASVKATHAQLQAIANKLCLCKDCLELSDNESYSEKGLKILQHLQKCEKDFHYELSGNTEQEGNGWSLLVNGEVVLKKNSTREMALEDFVKMLNNWQEANQKPACPLVTNSQQQADNQQHDYYYSPYESGHAEQAQYRSGYREHQSGPSGYRGGQREQPYRGSPGQSGGGYRGRPGGRDYYQY